MKSIEQAAREWWPLRVKELEATAINPGSVFPQSESELIKDLAAFHQHMLSKAPSEAVQGTALMDEEIERIAMKHYPPHEVHGPTGLLSIDGPVELREHFKIGLRYARDNGYLSGGTNAPEKLTESSRPPSRDALIEAGDAMYERLDKPREVCLPSGGVAYDDNQMHLDDVAQDAWDAAKSKAQQGRA